MSRLKVLKSKLEVLVEQPIISCYQSCCIEAEYGVIDDDVCTERDVESWQFFNIAPLCLSGG